MDATGRLLVVLQNVQNRIEQVNTKVAKVEAATRVPQKEGGQSRPPSAAGQAQGYRPMPKGRALQDQVDRIDRLIEIVDIDALDQLREIVNRITTMELRASGKFV